MNYLPLLLTAALATQPIGDVTYHGYTGTVHIEGAVDSFNYSNGVMTLVMSSPGDRIFKNGFEEKLMSERERNPLAKLYEFEGEQMTLNEIAKIVPIMSPHCLRSHLLVGRNTRSKITCYNPREALAAAGRKRAKQLPHFVI